MYSLIKDFFNIVFDNYEKHTKIEKREHLRKSASGGFKMKDIQCRPPLISWESYGTQIINFKNILTSKSVLYRKVFAQVFSFFLNVCYSGTGRVTVISDRRRR